MQRIRTPGHHRGWRASQHTPTAVARDIARSIRDAAAAGMQRHISEYTTDSTVVQLVQTLLHK